MKLSWEGNFHERAIRLRQIDMELEKFKLERAAKNENWLKKQTYIDDFCEKKEKKFKYKGKYILKRGVLYGKSTENI